MKFFPNRVSLKDEIQNQLLPTFISPSEFAQNLDIQSGNSFSFWRRRTRERGKELPRSLPSSELIGLNASAFASLKKPPRSPPPFTSGSAFFHLCFKRHVNYSTLMVASFLCLQERPHFHAWSVLGISRSASTIETQVECHRYDEGHENGSQTDFQDYFPAIFPMQLLRLASSPSHGNARFRSSSRCRTRSRPHCSNSITKKKKSCFLKNISDCVFLFSNEG